MTFLEFKQYIKRQITPLSISEIITEHPQLIRRTVQRWLNQLIKEEKIFAVGQGRGRKYYGQIDNSANPQSTDFPNHIPLTADSLDIVHYLAKPESARTPVGYQREFLDEYIPNQSYYLAEPIRRQLHRMGATHYAEQPAGTYGRDIYSRLLIDLSWASSHLEGNTYSRLDTVELIEHGRSAQGKDLLETQMILNHKSAIELLIDNADTVSFNRFTLLNLHSALAENLLPNPFDEGRIRTHIVQIGASVYRPMASYDALAIQLDLLLEKANQITDPFEQSFFIMVHLPYLQPFADVNKRTSRLAANISLIKANLCPLTFLDVPEQAYSKAMLGVYEMNRVELLRDLYIWAYERSVKEYLAVKQELVQPDQLRMQHREQVKKLVKEVVLSPQSSPLDVLENAQIDEENRPAVTALVLEELRRIHEGVLVRYGLRPSQLAAWKKAQE